MKITAEVIEQIKQANPDVEPFKLSTPQPGGGEPIEGVARRTKRQEFKMVRELLLSGDAAKKVHAEQVVFDSCVLYPSGTARDQLASKLPGIVSVWATEILEQSGIMGGTTVEKL